MLIFNRGLQGTKRALAHSQMRVGDVPGEYPSVCTGPYYRVPKKKKKKKTWERWTQGRPWLVLAGRILAQRAPANNQRFSYVWPRCEVID